ncbi:MAG: flagellar hook-associated protein FlgK, partial [Rhodospirillaceae bacterium]|nr:flagellar hook-associated protein FlgK [Rhodospirillaceae bacterium]
MTGNLTLALRTASSGLMTNQAALDSIASNISNVNTEGYSRKIANIQQRVVNGIGAGVELASVTRNVDEGLLKTLRGELSTLNSYSSQTSYFQRLQDTFGTLQDNSSISHILADFQSAIEQLTVSPEKTLEQREVVYQGEQIADKLNYMSGTIQDLRLQADNEIALVAAEMQLLVDNISTLNDSIVKGSVISRDLTSLEDQRDQSVTRLSELIDIKYFIRGDGDMIVFSGTGHTLIDADSHDITFNAASYISASVTEAEGDLSGIYVGTVADSNDIGPGLRSGRLQGLLELRDTILPNMQSQLDELSATLRDTVNAVHNAGVPFPGLTAMNGSRIFLDTSDVANVQAQTITLDATSGVDDVAIVLFDSDGNQSAATTLDTIMTSGMYGTGTQTTHGAWSIAEVAATVED